MLKRFLLPAFAIATLVFAGMQVIKAQQKPAPVSPPIEPGKSPYIKQLAGAGIVEPEGENIAIGSPVPGLVDKVLVRVGQKVKPDDLLFQLDDRSLVAEYAVRSALLRSSEASFKKIDGPPREDERPTQLAKVLEMKVNLDDQTQLYERMKRVASGAVSEEELAKRQMATKFAKAQYDRASADFALWEKGAWQPDRDIAKAAVMQAEASVAQTRTELSRLRVGAPHMRWKKGTKGEEIADDEGVEFEVLQVNIRPGEYVANTPGTALIVLGRVGKLHVRVDFDENDIARFKPELTGTAKLRGNPDIGFPLKFARVDPYVIPKKSLTGANTERVDTRVLQVIYALDTKGKSLYVGQQMDVFLNAE